MKIVLTEAYKRTRNGLKGKFSSNLKLIIANAEPAMWIVLWYFIISRTAFNQSTDPENKNNNNPFHMGLLKYNTIWKFGINGLNGFSE